ncbi:MAG: hypothetical protein PHE11_02880 [Candidatus Omnitrophica bacterium]|nr:hypothetical protein [Candidatus Omnitrophota bacterium]MDD5526333.1 hypothetical protein [Candidatus Omnitrophota bacterium]
MAKKKREPFTFESNLNKVVPRIEESPYRVLNIIGQTLVKEVRGTLRQYYRRRTGKLDKSLGYWARKKEKDLQIGFKIFYAPFVLDHNDPLKPVVEKNKYIIQDMIAKAIDEINKE